MVRLDTQLLFNACRLFDAENMDYLKEMILAYEQAVDLHNRCCPTHEIYQIRSEARLRKYVLESRLEDLQRLTISAIELATQAARNSIALGHEYEQIEALLANWDQTHVSKRAA